MSKGKTSKLILAIVVFASGCAVLQGRKLDELWGPPDPVARSAHARKGSSEDYQRFIQPILNNRCVVCHACYDAPCQLKLTSYEGLERGAKNENVYSDRLLAAAPTRLFLDASTPSEWRFKGFHPVLNERGQSSEANLRGSVFQRLLDLKSIYPLPKENVPLEGFDFSLNRTQQCPTIENFNIYEKLYSTWGMPYGLPALSARERDALTIWISNGAPYSEPAPLSTDLQKKVETWEQFFNGDSLKNRLVSRYLYEHLFIAHLYFEDASEREFFDLVRSKTPPGKPIDVIATRRPYGNPGVDRVYYRLRRVKSAIALKRHLPYALSAKRMKRYQELFLNPAYKVTALPSYEPKLASNPFATFREIPPVSRYKFLLDEAQYTIMNFIKGPVCRGQIALNVIRDNFWVVFLDPDVAILEDALDVLTVDGADSKALPAESGSNAVALANWLRYAELQKKYLIKKAKFAEKELYGKQLVNMNLIWDGDGENQNAALTIFRHFDNATVVKGLVGDKPQTAWIMGFSLLERIHYLLVAGFDIYGNVGHQLNTRLYMDFLRMEGESNFLGFLPKEQRAKVRDDWYRDARAHVKEYVYGDYSPQGRVDIKFVTDDPKNELLSKIEQRLQKVLPRAHALDRVKDGKARRELERLEQIVGKQVSVLPQLSFLSVKDVGVFTLINNSFHKSISHMFFEQLEREPEKDTLSVAYGFIGAHPNAFYVVEKDDLSTFVDAIDGLRDEDSYAKLVDRFGVRRNDPRFWAISDELHERFAKTAGVEAGIFDYNRYENR